MKVIDNQGRTKDVGLKGDQGVQGAQGNTGPGGAVGPTGPGNGLPADRILIWNTAGGF